jgi:hypothetical protein
VFRGAFVESSPLCEVTALVLDCGDQAVASGPTAAALHGFDGISLRPPYHVTLPRGHRVRRPAHRVHTTLELPLGDRTRAQGIPAMSPTRTLVDLAKFVRPSVLTAALDGALRDRLTTEVRLHTRIAELRSQGRYGIPALLAVIEGSEITRGGHSWLERRFLELCHRGRIPPPLTQQVLSRAKDRLVRVDFRFPGTPLVVEVLGYRWHGMTKEQLARDAERLNALVLDGLRPIQFTYDHVTLQPEWVIDQVRTALRTAA